MLVLGKSSSCQYYLKFISPHIGATGGLAQMVEQLLLDKEEAGSNPAPPPPQVYIQFMVWTSYVRLSMTDTRVNPLVMKYSGYTSTN